MFSGIGICLLRGGTTLLHAGTCLLRGGTTLLHGGTCLLRSGTTLLYAGTYLLTGGILLLRGGTKHLFDGQYLLPSDKTLLCCDGKNIIQIILDFRYRLFGKSNFFSLILHTQSLHCIIVISFTNF